MLSSMNGYLFTFRLRQNEFLENRTIKPLSLYQFIALLFGFWGWLLIIGRESLKRYIGFQWGRAVINKMFFYSRTKSKFSKASIPFTSNGDPPPPPSDQGKAPIAENDKKDPSQ